MALTRTTGRRKSISMRTKLIVTLRELGLTIEEVQFDHDPALSQRKWSERRNDFVPAQDDAAHIKLLLITDHKRRLLVPETSAGFIPEALTSPSRAASTA